MSITLTCTQTLRESDDTVTAWFDCSHPVTAKAGQFITLAVPIENRTHQRSYSLSAFDTERAPNAVRITVKRVEDGLVSNWLVDHCEEGLTLQASEPMGNFTLDSDAKTHAFIAAGSGISPIAAMLQELAEHHPNTPANLLYIVRHAKTAPLLTELKTLSVTYPQLQIKVWDTATLGRPNALQLSALLTAWEADTHYVCGPEALIDTVSKLTLNRLRMERFNAAVYNFETVKPDGAAITFSESQKTIEITEAETILDLAEANGIAVNSSCRSGVCHECKLRHNNPEAIVWLEEENALTDEEKKEYLLACCTTVAGKVDIAC